MCNGSSFVFVSASEKTIVLLQKLFFTAALNIFFRPGKSFNYLNAQVESFFTHNWSKDPFARGAYSYVALGGLASARRLKKPFEDTIYIIGEGTALDASRGTVHGAFESGYNLKL